MGWSLKGALSVCACVGQACVLTQEQSCVGWSGLVWSPSWIEGVSAMNGTVLAIGEKEGNEGSPFITGNKRGIRERRSRCISLGLSNSSRFEGRTKPRISFYVSILA